MDNEFKIVAEGWPGIFLNEAEAALALAGRSLPDRILEQPDVSRTVRFRAASEEAYREELLLGSTRYVIARWIKSNVGELEIDPRIKVDLYRTTTWDEKADAKTFKEFRMAVGGRSYNMEDSRLLLDAMQIAYRLEVAATFHMENRKLAERIVNQ